MKISNNLEFQVFEFNSSKTIWQLLNDYRRNIRRIKIRNSNKKSFYSYFLFESLIIFSRFFRDFRKSRIFEIRYSRFWVFSKSPRFEIRYFRFFKISEIRYSRFFLFSKYPIFEIRDFCFLKISCASLVLYQFSPYTFSYQ